MKAKMLGHLEYMVNNNTLPGGQFINPTFKNEYQGYFNQIGNSWDPSHFWLNTF
jgi:hypothetical protein